MKARRNDRDGRAAERGRDAEAGAAGAASELAPDRAGYVFGGAAGALLLMGLVHPNRAQPGVHLVFFVGWVVLGAVFFLQALAMRPRAGSRFLGSAGALAAGLLGLWTLGRWLGMALPVPGGGAAVRTPWAGAQAVSSALAILPSMLMAAGAVLIPTDSGGAIAARTLRRLLALSIFGFAAQALYQRFIGYEIQLRDLKEALATSQTLSPLMAQSMIHALEEKRVGGPFGNANLLAGCVAVLTALVPSLWLDRIAGRKRLGPALALAAGAAGLATVLLTGSRGGALSWIFGLAAGTLAARRASGAAGFPGVGWLGKRPRLGPAATLLFAIALTAVARQAAAETLFERIGRIDTIRERFHYWSVAARVWAEAPVVGDGPGSFELRYPALKPPTARESRYPHSWVFALGSETGLVGLGLFAALIASSGAATRRAWRSAARVGDQTPAKAPKDPTPAEILFFSAAAATLLFNGLFEYSLQTREFMILLAALLGAIVGLGALDENQSGVDPGAGRRKPRAILGGAISAAVIAAALVLTTKLQMSAVWEWRGRMAAQEGQHDEAAERFERALGWTPDNDAHLASRAMALYASAPQNPAPALELLTRAERVNPLSAKLRQSHAEILNRMGKLDAAADQLNEAARLYPNDAGVRLDRADLNLKRSQPDAAREDVLYIRDAGLPVWEYQQPALDALMKQLKIPARK